MIRRDALSQTNEKPAASEGASARYRPALLAGGYFFFLLGLLGLALPLLPTTVFWIAASACFAKSSPSMYRRILAWPRIGQAIEAFLDQGAISRQGKMIAISGMALGALLVVFGSLGTAPTVAALTVIASAGVYVWTRQAPPENVHAS